MLTVLWIFMLYKLEIMEREYKIPNRISVAVVMLVSLFLCVMQDGAIIFILMRIK